MAKQSRKKSANRRRTVDAVKSAKKSGSKARKAPAKTKPPLLLLAKNPRPKKKFQLPALPWRHIAAWSAAGAVALVAVWLLGNMFCTRVQLAGKTVARQSNAQLTSLVQHDVTNYRLTIAYPDKHRQAFTLQDIGLQVDVPKTVADARAQQRSLAQRLAWWQPVQLQLRAGVNSERLKNFIANHASIVTKPAANATISIDNGQVKLTNGTPGKQYGLANATGTVLSAAVQLRIAPLALTAVALPPSVSAPALAATKAKLEATLQQEINIQVGGQTVTPSAQDIASWLTLTPTTAGVDVDVNKDNVSSYLDGVAYSYSNPERSQIVDGSGNIVIAGAKGVSVGSTSDTANKLADAVLQANGAALTLPATLTGFKTETAPTTGKWIEVDLSTKRMYAYDGSSLDHSFLVSAGAAATPTVTGQFAIYSKYRSQNMFGENVDGSSYYQPNVPYVNYFYKDYAIHGNYWRPASYFGNVNSSHGCVGVSVSDGAWMYSWAPIGTPVVVHY